MRGGDDMSVRIKDPFSHTLDGGNEEIFEIEPLDPVGIYKKNKAHLFKRKSSGKTYTNPRIILDSSLIDLIGKSYEAFKGKAIFKRMQDRQEVARIKGRMVVLFFPDGDAADLPGI
jgi:hypothetical protein